MSEKFIARLLELAIISAMFTNLRIPETADASMPFLLLFFALNYVMVLFAYAFGHFLFEQLNVTEIISRRRTALGKIFIFMLFIILIFFITFMFCG